MVARTNILGESWYVFFEPDNIVSAIKISLVLILSLSIGGRVVAETGTVKSVSLYVPPDTTPIDFTHMSNTAYRWKPPACLTCGDVAPIQAQLNRLGYESGRVDGVLGPLTTAAIRAYQADKNLPVDRQVTGALLMRLRAQN